MARDNKSPQDMKDEARMHLISRITADQVVLDNADHVAMNQEELQGLLVNPPEAIYLVGGPFSIPSAKNNIRYIGLNKPEVTLEKGKLIADYNAAGISFKNVRYSSPYRCTEAEQLFLTGRYAEALPLLEDAAGQGNPRAMYMMAIFYEHGLGMISDLRTCREWLQRSFGMKEPVSSMKYADVCYAYYSTSRAQILSEFAEDLKSLALSGDELAQFEFWNYVLKKDLHEPRSAVRDCEKAFEWYSKAIANGFTLVQDTLGDCYYYGRGVRQDHEKAVEWYRKAAEQGDAWAQCDLGFCYEKGRGVEQDYEKAIEWYLKAAEQEDSRAQDCLGDCYYLDQGVKQDYEKAIKWYRKAAEQENACAQCNLGRMYELGHGVVQDYAEAIKWYLKAAEQENDWAQYQLGLLYEKGHGGAQNQAKAVEWYRKAAEQGDARAQKKLHNLSYVISIIRRISR